MSKILKSALEDLLNVEKAIEIVNKEDSADPEDMILVSTYQDELDSHRSEWINNDLLSKFVNKDLRIFNIYDF